MISGRFSLDGKGRATAFSLTVHRAGKGAPAATLDLPAVAAYVDARMTEVSEKTGTFDDYTVAMLAALNIASDFERFRREVDGDLAGMDRELAAAQVLLESAIPPSAPADDGGDAGT